MKQCTSCMKFIYVLFVIHLSITTVCAQIPNNTPQYVLNSIASVENKDIEEDLSDSESFETTIIVQAASDGNWKKVKELLDAGYSVHETDFEGMTLLHYAALNSDDNTIIMLIKAGADINAKVLGTQRAYDFALNNAKISSRVRALLK